MENIVRAKVCICRRVLANKNRQLVIKINEELVHTRFHCSGHFGPLEAIISSKGIIFYVVSLVGDLFPCLFVASVVCFFCIYFFCVLINFLTVATATKRKSFNIHLWIFFFFLFHWNSLFWWTCWKGRFIYLDICCWLCNHGRTNLLTPERKN